MNLLDLLHNSGQVVAIVAAFAACMSALATFWTVREIAKQRQTSYLPDLWLSRVSFVGTSNPMVQGKLPILWREKAAAADGSRDPILGGLSVPIVNVGLGTAKDVKLRWNFAILDAIKRANNAAQGRVQIFV